MCFTSKTGDRAAFSFRRIVSWPTSDTESSNLDATKCRLSSVLSSSCRCVSTNSRFDWRRLTHAQGQVTRAFRKSSERPRSRPVPQFDEIILHLKPDAQLHSKRLKRSLPSGVARPKRRPVLRRVLLFLRSLNGKSLEPWEKCCDVPAR